MPAQLFPFVIVAVVLTLTPGPDMVLVLRNGLRGGITTAWWTGLGCCSGIAVHAGAAVIGLSALLAASVVAFTIVKFVGAAYLVYLGVSAIWNTRPAAARKEQGTPGPAPEPAAITRAVAYRQGVLSNVLNPKIALIFLTLIPQFISRGEPVFLTTAMLALVFLSLAVLWWRVFSLAVAPLGRVLSRPSIRRVFDRATGAVLVGLGARVALSEH